MKNTILAIALLLPAPALAQSAMTVTIGDVAETWNMAAPDQTKFEAWVQSAYKCEPQPSCAPLTLAESESLWAKATLQGTADNVTKFQNMVAATAAINATTPIGFATSGKRPGPKGPPPDDKMAPKK